MKNIVLAVLAGLLGVGLCFLFAFYVVEVSIGIAFGFIAYGVWSVLREYQKDE